MKDYTIKFNFNGHYVYKYVYNGDIIYVGKTDVNLAYRLSQHGKKGDNIPETAWNEINASAIYYCKLLSSKQCDIYESELIRRYKPKYNKAKTQEWDGVDIPEPIWTEYLSGNDWESKCLMLTNKIETLQKQYDALNKSHKELCKAFDEYKLFAESECETLNNENDNLINEITSLHNRIYEIMNKDKSTITQSAYDILLKKYNNVLKENFILKNGGIPA